MGDRITKSVRRDIASNRVVMGTWAERDWEKAGIRRPVSRATIPGVVRAVRRYICVKAAASLRCAAVPMPIGRAESDSALPP